jgi:hypothetical protein
VRHANRTAPTRSDCWILPGHESDKIAKLFRRAEATQCLRPIDGKPAFWEYGFMKTTLDLPEDLMREVKIRAVHEHKKLKDAIAEFIRKGIAASKSPRRRLPKPVRLRGGPLTTEEIEAAIAWGRE